MKYYNWIVLVNNKIAGYVRSESEIDALRIAKDKIAKDVPFFIERTYLGNIVPEDTDFWFSSNKNWNLK